MTHKSVGQDMMHTPGPWRVYLSEADAYGPDDGFSPIGGCGCCDSPWANGADNEKSANVRLISLAPELVDALRELMDFDSESYDRKSHRAMGLLVAKKKARALLAKLAGAS